MSKNVHHVLLFRMQRIFMLYTWHIYMHIYISCLFLTNTMFIIPYCVTEHIFCNWKLQTQTTPQSQHILIHVWEEHAIHVDLMKPVGSCPRLLCNVRICKLLGTLWPEGRVCSFANRIVVNIQTSINALHICIWEWVHYLSNNKCD